MKNIISAVVAASAFLSIAASAQADEAQMHVRLSGVNVASETGAREALARIRRSAAVFCDQSQGRVSLERQQAANACVEQMTHRSVAQLNAPTVTALLGGAPAAQPTQVAMAR